MNPSDKALLQEAFELMQDLPKTRTHTLYDAPPVLRNDANRAHFTCHFCGGKFKYGDLFWELSISKDGSVYILMCHDRDACRFRLAVRVTPKQEEDPYP